MKKSVAVYSVWFAICLALFNVLVFVTPNSMAGYDKFGGAFWVGYVFITVAFLGELACGLYALMPKQAQKVFYRISLVKISYTGLVLTAVAGTVCMAIPDLPNWIGIILCFVILALNVIAMVKAVAAAAMAEETDRKVKASTAGMKLLAVDAQGLVAVAPEGTRAQAQRVCDAIRYSDPVTSPELAETESAIQIEFRAFADAVKAGDTDLSRDLGDALVAMVDERNLKCKVLK